MTTLGFFYRAVLMYPSLLIGDMAGLADIPRLAFTIVWILIVLGAIRYFRNNTEA